MAHEQYSFINFDKGAKAVKKNNVVSALGMPLESLDEYTSETIDTLIKECSGLIKPWGIVYKSNNFHINETLGTITTNAQLFDVGRLVAKSLVNSEQLVFFICSAGDSIETYSKQLLSEKQLLEGYIVDIIGSESAESVAEYVHQQIKGVAELKHMLVTNRYSPGYCNWNVAEQHKLFGLFPENKKKVYLTPSALMQPVKSVSGVLGVGKNVEFNQYMCDFCTQKNCTYSAIKKRTKTN